MAFTVRGATYTDTVPGTIALPAGTLAGDLLLLSLYGTSFDYVLPDSTTVTGYDPTVAAGIWQVVGSGSFVLGSSDFKSVVHCFRLATSADVSATTITMTEAGGICASLVALTGDNLQILPSDWGFVSGDSEGPCYQSGFSGLVYSGGTTTVNATYTGRASSLAIYVGVLSHTDSGAAITGGTTLLDTPASQQLMVSYETINSYGSLSASMTTSYVYDGTGSGADAYLYAIVIPSLVLDTGADNFADALPITLAVTGDTYLAPAIDNRALTVQTGEPTVSGHGSRSAWWSYTPAIDGTLTIDTELDPGSAYCLLMLCTGDTVGAQTVLASDDGAGPNGTALISYPVLASSTYYIKVASWTTGFYDDAIYLLRASGPATGASTLHGAPPAVAEASMPVPGGPLSDNNLFAFARPITITANGGPAASPAVSNIDFDRETGEDTLAFRTAWYKYQPIDTGWVHFDTSACTGTQTDQLNIGIFRGSSVSTLDRDFTADAATSVDSVAVVEFMALAGTTYYVRIGTDGAGDDESLVQVAGYGPRTTNPVAVPPMESWVSFAPTIPPRVVATPPMQAEGSTPAPGNTRFVFTWLDPPITDQDHATVVPTTTPVFRASFRLVTGTATTVTLQVQYDIGASTITVTDTEDIAGTVVFAIPVSAPVAADWLYYWQATLTYDGITHTIDTVPDSGGQPPAFQVPALATTTDTAPVTWSIAAGTATPHLWSVTPTAALPGERVTLSGQGMGATAGTVTLAGLSATIVSWTRVADSGASTGRVIDPHTPFADCEHTEILITVPAAPTPGGTLVVET